MSDITADPLSAPPAAGFTLLSGRVGDIMGRHRVPLAGLALRAETGS